MNSAPPPPSYVVLSENSGSLRPPPYHRNVPRYQSANHQKRGRGRCCLKCVCCCYCFLFLFLFLISGLVLFFYTFYKPQIPTYQVQDLSVQSFDLQPDFSLLTEFLVTVRAENPNENIEFIYGKDSAVTVSYKASRLCTGNLPSFRQGHKNITMIKVLLRGKSEFGSGLQEALMQNKNNGHIPLLVEVNVPVSIVVAEIPMRQFMVFVNCSLVVDNLSPNKKIGILSSKYDVGFSFRV